jgi:predicted dehydrogenase
MLPKGDRSRGSTSRLSRRSLLKRAGAAIASFHIIPAAALGRTRRAASSERLGLGIIGLKKMGGGHVRHLLTVPDVQIVAVCDVRRDLREETRNKVDEAYAAERRDGRYAGCAAYNEYEKLLARADVDAVVIATPDHWHAMIAIAACRAGKDVYCEKPLSLTIRESRQMVRAARRYQRVFQTGSQQRSMWEFRHACELVRNGYIGDMKRVHVEIGPCSRHVELPEEPVPPGFDYERWLGPAAWAPYNKLRCGSYYDDGWRRIRDYSGGKMTDWGAHHLDIVQWALGMDKSGPVEIVPPTPGAAAGWGNLPPIIEGPGASPLDPTWGLTYRYANGVEVIKDGTNGVQFVGSEGEIEVNRGRLQTRPASLKSLALRPTDVHLQRSEGHHRNWLNCIRQRGRPICDVEIGCRSATVCHLGNIALWLNRAIRWDPEREQIVGDERAAMWLDRPKRAPYRVEA